MPRVAGATEIVGLYRRHGLAWAQVRERQPAEAVWLDRFCALMPEVGTVLDLGCGVGRPVARYLVERGFGVVGVDTSPEMLAVGRAEWPALEWIQADMRTLALGRRVAGILAWNSFFHLDHDDQRAMFAVFEAHAAPGAPLMFTSGPAHGEAIGTLEGEPLYHASLDPAEYRRLLTRHGFVERAHVAQDPACHGLTIWLAQSA